LELDQKFKGGLIRIGFKALTVAASDGPEQQESNSEHGALTSRDIRLRR
jgi:hypothetical protein